MRIDDIGSGFNLESFADEVTQFMPDQETVSAGKSSGGKHGPVLVISRVLYKKVTVSIKSGTYEYLTKYQTFYQPACGFKPEEGEIIDAALQKVFEEDKEFQSYLANGGGARESRRQPAISNGVGKGGGQE